MLHSTSSLTHSYFLKAFLVFHMKAPVGSYMSALEDVVFIPLGLLVVGAKVTNPMCFLIISTVLVIHRLMLAVLFCPSPSASASLVCSPTPQSPTASPFAPAVSLPPLYT